MHTNHKLYDATTATKCIIHRKPKPQSALNHAQNNITHKYEYAITTAAVTPHTPLPLTNGDHRVTDIYSTNLRGPLNPPEPISSFVTPQNVCKGAKRNRQHVRPNTAFSPFCLTNAKRKQLKWIIPIRTENWLFGTADAALWYEAHNGSICSDANVQVYYWIFQPLRLRWLASVVWNRCGDLCVRQVLRLYGSVITCWTNVEREWCVM